MGQPALQLAWQRRVSLLEPQQTLQRTVLTHLSAHTRLGCQGRGFEKQEAMGTLKGVSEAELEIVNWS